MPLCSRVKLENSNNVCLFFTAGKGVEKNNDVACVRHCMRTEREKPAWARDVGLFNICVLGKAQVD